jgi:NADH:ubiquinone oxidoreductase subunit 3 (subunit A)
LPRTKENDECGIFIPIVILSIVFLVTGIVWLVIPIVVLIIVFIQERNQQRKIKSKKERIDYWRATEPGAYTSGTTPESHYYNDKSIYDRTKQKEQGSVCGLLIPIFIIGILWFVFDFDWWFLIPLVVLVFSFVSTIIRQSKGKQHIISELRRGDVCTIPEIASRTGMSEDKVRKHIVEEKRSGTTDVWFDPSTGTATSTPTGTIEASPDTRGSCPYCGFELRHQDRFCPYCGAPIKAR